MTCGWGGKREGAGRKREDVFGRQRKKHSIYCTDVELKKVRKYLQILRQQESLLVNPDSSQVMLFDDGQHRNT